MSCSTVQSQYGTDEQPNETCTEQIMPCSVILHSVFDKAHSCDVYPEKIDAYRIEPYKIPSEGKMFRCDVCEKKFIFRRDLADHFLSHYSGKCFTCNDCPQKFLLKGDLIAHLRRHAGEVPFACNICNKQYSSEQMYLKHSKMHAAWRPFVCDKCPKSFNAEYLLIRHLQCHYRQFECKMCRKIYASQRNLKRHYANFHRNDASNSFDTCIN